MMKAHTIHVLLSLLVESFVEYYAQRRGCLIKSSGGMVVILVKQLAYTHSLVVLYATGGSNTRILPLFD